jgi:hypothetical protein
MTIAVQLFTFHAQFSISSTVSKPRILTVDVNKYLNDVLTYEISGFRCDVVQIVICLEFCVV